MPPRIPLRVLSLGLFAAALLLLTAAGPNQAPAQQPKVAPTQPVKVELKVLTYVKDTTLVLEVWSDGKRLPIDEEPALGLIQKKLADLGEKNDVSVSGVFRYGGAAGGEPVSLLIGVEPKAKGKKK